jgi:hypothetical protein
MIGGDTLLTMNSKGGKEKYQKINIRSMKIGGESPRGDTILSLMSKEERNIGHMWSMSVGL